MTARTNVAEVDRADDDDEDITKDDAKDGTEDDARTSQRTS